MSEPGKTTCSCGNTAKLGSNQCGACSDVIDSKRYLEESLDWCDSIEDIKNWLRENVIEVRN